MDRHTEAVYTSREIKTRRNNSSLSIGRREFRHRVYVIAVELYIDWEVAAGYRVAHMPYTQPQDNGERRNRNR